jgi:hypothetical protein
MQLIIFNVNFCRKGVDVPVPRFDKNMEEFYSICDQIELHLVSASLCFMELNVSVHGTQYAYCLLQSRYCLLCHLVLYQKPWEDLTVTSLPSATCEALKVKMLGFLFIYMYKYVFFVCQEQGILNLLDEVVLCQLLGETHLSLDKYKLNLL